MSAWDSFRVCSRHASCHVDGGVNRWYNRCRDEVSPPSRRCSVLAKARRTRAHGHGGLKNKKKNAVYSCTCVSGTAQRFLTRRIPIPSTMYTHPPRGAYGRRNAIVILITRRSTGVHEKRVPIDSPSRSSYPPPPRVRRPATLEKPRGSGEIVRLAYAYGNQCGSDLKAG